MTSRPRAATRWRPVRSCLPQIADKIEIIGALRVGARCAEQAHHQCNTTQQRTVPGRRALTLSLRFESRCHFSSSWNLHCRCAWQGTADHFSGRNSGSTPNLYVACNSTLVCSMDARKCCAGVGAPRQRPGAPKEQCSEPSVVHIAQ